MTENGDAKHTAREEANNIQRSAGFEAKIGTILSFSRLISM